MNQYLEFADEPALVLDQLFLFKQRPGQLVERSLLVHQPGFQHLEAWCQFVFSRGHVSRFPYQGRGQFSQKPALNCTALHDWIFTRAVRGEYGVLGSAEPLVWPDLKWHLL